MPRSPCTLSAGWRNAAGVPVEVSVAAIFRPTSPDLPTPATITRPVRLRDQRDGAARTSSPSRSSTVAERLALEADDAPPALDDLARTSSAPTLRAVQRALRTYASVTLLPLAARPEQQLGELAHGAASAVARELERARGANLGDGVRRRRPAARRGAGRRGRGNRRRRTPPRTARSRGGRASPGTRGACARRGSCATSSTPSSAARSRTLSETRPVTIATRMPARCSRWMPRPSWMS